MFKDVRTTTTKRSIGFNANLSVRAKADGVHARREDNVLDAGIDRGPPPTLIQSDIRSPDDGTPDKMFEVREISKYSRYLPRVCGVVKLTNTYVRYGLVWSIARIANITYRQA